LGTLFLPCTVPGYGLDDLACHPFSCLRTSSAYIGHLRRDTVESVRVPSTIPQAGIMRHPSFLSLPRPCACLLRVEILSILASELRSCDPITLAHTGSRSVTHTRAAYPFPFCETSPWPYPFARRDTHNARTHTLT
jgi:hypothetical protein